MVSAIENRDPYTSGHKRRVIHDTGKLSVPAEILSKSTKLTEIEFSLIKEDSRKGCKMLKDVESPWLLAEIVYQHHERMDGSGYPRNLKGDDIFKEARIMAVADIVESMSSHRPYRPTIGLNAALARYLCPPVSALPCVFMYIAGVNDATEKKYPIA
jgi:HD-GYP domain-containing protein (c-di-GMP phosphodiesterase class II)